MHHEISHFAASYILSEDHECSVRNDKANCHFERSGHALAFSWSLPRSEKSQRLRTFTGLLLVKHHEISHFGASYILSEDHECFVRNDKEANCHFERSGHALASFLVPPRSERSQRLRTFTGLHPVTHHEISHFAASYI